MEPKKIDDLVKGDIFCHEVKLNNREAFIVFENDEKKKRIKCKSRTTDIEVSKERGQFVVFLRHQS